MTKFNDFRGVEFPQTLVKLGFKDLSYHNDAAARAEKNVGSEVVVVWCLAKSRDERVDYGDSVTRRTPRFRGYVAAADANGYADDASGGPVRYRFSCEAETDLRKRVETVLAKLEADAKATPRGRRQK